MCTKMKIRYKLMVCLIIALIILCKLIYDHYHVEYDEEITEKSVSQSIKITVYYETLCPDSKLFIVDQLMPFYESNTLMNVQMELVPYGKAQTVESANGKLEFHCQHSTIECFANRIHACVIALFPDPRLQLRYVACMIVDNSVPEEAADRCGRRLAVAEHYDAVVGCARGERGADLLKAHGVKTHALRPPITFVPTIELDGSRDVVRQAVILNDLKRAVCDVFEMKGGKC